MKTPPPSESPASSGRPGSFDQRAFAPPVQPFGRVTFEMSLKPFYDTHPATREAVCRRLFTQWLPLCHEAKKISVMLWVGDGSEYMEFTGDLDATFEWGYWLGAASKHTLAQHADQDDGGQEDEGALGLHGTDADPQGVGLHRRPYLYRKQPARFTYRWLRDLTRDLKRIGQQITGRPIEVGDTYDPGPEFAKSVFKYDRHPEIITSGTMFGTTFAYCGSTLSHDPNPYAGFPKGIPQGTHLGTFMGRQSVAFHGALGFDFLWLSNGFGFGSETWSLDGRLFDGQTFAPGRAREIESQVLEFWRCFRTEAPDIPLRVRGTNMTTGIDLASDAVPLQRIYQEVRRCEPPVNSPWAAMDGDFGLELAGWMSHIAELPGESYPFRFYTHDPWWMNSPWLDRYERQPHDIYMPLSVCRLTAQGEAHPPDSLSLLTVDNSLGELPDQVAMEVTAHMTRAREHTPDQAGPVVWVYPFDEYHAMTFGDAPDASKLREVYFGDWYIRGAINQGLPLNTVISTKNFLTAATENPQGLRGSVLLVPTAVSPKVREQVMRHVADGGRAIYYGPLDAGRSDLRACWGLEERPGLEGDFEIDRVGGFATEANGPTRIHHPEIFSGGALADRAAEVLPTGVEELARAQRGGDARCLAMLAQDTAWNGGMLGWLRGAVSCDETRTKRLLPMMLDPQDFFHVEALALRMLERMGTSHRHQRKSPDDRPPMLCLSRSRNAFMVSGYNPDNARVDLRLPLGAPVLTSQHTRLEQGHASYTPPTAWHGECRFLIEQQAASDVYCKELPVVMAGVQRRLLLRGLRDAVVRFFPPPQAEHAPIFLRDPSFPYLVGGFIEPTRVESSQGVYYQASAVTGRLLVSW